LKKYVILMQEYGFGLTVFQVRSLACSSAQTCGTTDKFILENNGIEIYFLKPDTNPFKMNSIVRETTEPSAASDRNRSEIDQKMNSSYVLHLPVTRTTYALFAEDTVSQVNKACSCGHSAVVYHTSSSSVYSEGNKFL
jgi:hypothetical protein